MAMAASMLLYNENDRIYHQLKAASKIGSAGQWQSVAVNGVANGNGWLMKSVI